jgi:hypothetical protein
VKAMPAKRKRETTLKDWPKVYRTLKGIRGISEEERVRLAKASAATPDERWALNVKKIKELGFWGRGIEGKQDFDKYVKKHGVPTWV